MDKLKDYIRTIPDYPKAGIMFRDITTLLTDADGFGMAVDGLVQLHQTRGIDIVAGIEARGFILGGAVARELGLGFVPIRKKGKLPCKTYEQEYELEYGQDVIEIHTDSISPGHRVLLIDDLLATGGTAEAAVKLIQKAQGSVAACSFVVELPDLGGRARLQAMDTEVLSLCRFEGE